MALARTQEQLGLSQLDALLRAARERAVTMFGDPNIAGLVGFGLDPQAGTFARQNYLSGNATLAQLDKQHELQRRAIINRLAGRGILFSGDLGYLSGEAAQQHGQRVYSARQQLLDYFADLANKDLDQRRGLSGGVAQSYQNAYQNYITNPEAYLGMLGIGTRPGTPPSPYGVLGPEGRLPIGTPMPPPAAPPAAAPLKRRPRIAYE